MENRPPYRVIVTWQNGTRTIVAESPNPTELAGAPTVSRNPRVIKRIEIHDLTGPLETVWDASWENSDAE